MKIFENVEMKEYSNMKIGGIAKELIVIEDKSRTFCCARHNWANKCR